MTVPSGQAEVLVTPLASGGAVLLQLETLATFTLNASGYRIWELLHDGCSPEEVAAGLASEFEVDADRARASVMKLCRELNAVGLLSEDGGPG